MLLNDLYKLYTWADANTMKFDAKFKILRYGNEQEIKTSIYKSYDDSNDSKEQVRDLGILMSSTASHYNSHVRNAV